MCPEIASRADPGADLELGLRLAGLVGATTPGERTLAQPSRYRPDVQVEARFGGVSWPTKTA